MLNLKSIPLGRHFGIYLIRFKKMYQKCPQECDLVCWEGHRFKQMYQKCPQECDLVVWEGHRFKKMY